MASQTAKINYILRRGDTTSFTQTLSVGASPEEAIPFDLTGWQLNAQVKYDPDDSTAWFNLPISVIDAAAGKFRIYWTATESAALLPIGSTDSPSAGYDLQIRKIGDEENTTSTIQEGLFTVVDDYTRVPPNIIYVNYTGN